MSRQAAHRYAKALFEFADEHEMLEQIHSELHDFGSLLQKNEFLHMLFYSMDLNAFEKQKILDDLLKEKASVNFTNFIKLVFQKRRENFFADMIEFFDEHYDKKQNQIRARLNTAVPIDENVNESIVSSLSKSFQATVLMESNVDPQILGGFQLFIEDKMIDASLRRKLDELASRLRERDTN